ncbi:MAG: HAD family phosphatase [Bacteroidetes bacterium]|nr:HAD family phosphatase [Bacteroidota bacterium]MBS1756234.1 HAD family phosphatase [Bacteroidota bacterium]
MANPQNIIFDFGGVLLNLDFNRTYTAFQQLGFSNFENMFTQYTANDLFKKLETGLVSPDEFYRELISAHPKVSKEEIEEAWNAMLLDYRLPSLEYLKKLAQHHRLYLLSNTNAIHYDVFTKRLQEETGISSPDVFFTKAYYSHLIHLRKPDKEIFEFVLKDAGINASDTLFIDDSYNNIEAASALGIRVHLLIPGETIESLPYFTSS